MKKFKRNCLLGGLFPKTKAEKIEEKLFVGRSFAPKQKQREFEEELFVGRSFAPKQK
ncbi:MAG: hypothetical protein GY696_20700 [Gammaproteobacteria bacterium]|nr:hypothetical protein [Gammaproteobacteria bacterium]